MDKNNKYELVNVTTVLIPKGTHIFIIEDDWSRIFRLRKMIGTKATVTWAKDNVEAIKKFQSEKNKINLLMVDHDLGDTKYSRDDSTIEFVEWLAANHKGYKIPTIIHSLNPRGAIKIKYTLQQANFSRVYQIPFEYIRIQVEE